MPMRNHPHPGHLIRDEIDALGLSVAEAARGLGITRQQLYRILRGQSGISPEVALRLEQAIGSTADHWLRMQASYDLALARPGAPKLKKLEPKQAA
jgi:addiction module HigA family antidote